jgi:hypothetical protein
MSAAWVLALMLLYGMILGGALSLAAAEFVNPWRGRHRA